MESHKIHAPKHQPDLAPGSSTFHELEQNMKHQIIHPDLLDGFIMFYLIHYIQFQHTVDGCEILHQFVIIGNYETLHLNGVKMG